MSRPRPARRTTPRRRRAPLTVRIAVWSSRHRWPVVVLWLVLTIGTFVLSGAMGGIRTSDSSGADDPTNETDSQRGPELFGALPPGVAKPKPYESIYLVITDPALKVTDPAYQATIRDIAQRLQAVTVDVAAGHRTGALRPGRAGRHRPAAGTHLGRPVERPDLRSPRRRQGRGRGPAGAAEAGAPGPQGRAPRLHHPGPQEHHHQRRHRHAHLAGPGRLADDDHPADVPDPAGGLRRRGGRGRAAAPGVLGAARRIRAAGHLQPAGRAGQPVRRRSSSCSSAWPSRSTTRCS